ncbi:hypothetical protein NGC36_21120 [Serratia rubidaea]|uniref:hypothetical protein n=1 Tax=Serratia rubidaea TaxID=61652 RepID=UPI002DBBC6D1|nr:hypothetical protein [Serratia rubidaea]MEB7587771.1 hypothetical protein [Serratia rubidaea]
MNLFETVLFLLFLIASISVVMVFVLKEFINPRTDNDEVVLLGLMFMAGGASLLVLLYNLLYILFTGEAP